jgi:hypothetical protein
MRTRFAVRTIVPALVALAVLMFGATLAQAHGNGHRTLRVVGVENQFQFLDLGAAGPSLGDELVFSQVLLRRGHEVGDAGGVCTVTEAVPPYDVLTYHCVATLRLQRGQITLQGLVEFQGEGDQGPFTVAITGGTGAFRSAGGEARIRIRGDRTTYRLRLDLPHKKKHHHGR